MATRSLAGPTRTQPLPGRGGGAGRGRVSAAGLLPPDPRRTIYGYVDRADMSEVLNTFDFPSPNAASGRRYETTVPQQALFLMNSPLVIEQVRRVVNRDAFQDADSDEARVRYLYELFFQRPPKDEELRAGQQFIATYQPSAAAPPAAPAAAPHGFGQGARGQQAPVRLPLSGSQEYAHALLLTNEAAFLNWRSRNHQYDCTCL